MSHSGPTISPAQKAREVAIGGGEDARYTDYQTADGTKLERLGRLFANEGGSQKKLSIDI